MTWRKAHHTVGTRRCIVDLVEVTSIDRNGEAILTEIMSQNAKFISGDVYTEHLLRSLRNNLKRRLPKRKKEDGINP